ncbi:MAG: thioredoxin [Chitinophagaceae bacterium]|nr:MAG: thioredoxin [Chitinophagaceae bacterium]
METFDQLINGDTPVLVDFYADWCGPCKAMEPTVKEVAKSLNGKTRVIKLDIDRNQPTANKYNVRAVPTFILFRKGKEIWRHPGMIDKAGLLSVLNEHSSQ